MRNSLKRPWLFVYILCTLYFLVSGLDAADHSGVLSKNPDDNNKDRMKLFSKVMTNSSPLLQTEAPRLIYLEREKLYRGNMMRILQSDLTVEEKDEMQIFTKIFEIANKIITIGCLVVLSIGKSNPAIAFLPGNVKFWAYIKYLHVKYPKKLQFMLDNIGSDFVSFNFGPGLPSKDLEVLTKTSSFIIIYWPIIFALAIVMIVIILLSVLSCLTRKHKTLNRILEGLALIPKWNFMLMVFCSNFDVLIFSTSLQFRTEINGSLEIILNLLFCCVFNLLALIILGVAFYATVDIFKKLKAKVSLPQNIDQLQVPINPMIKWKEFQIFFRGLKVHSRSQLNFLTFTLIRISAFNLVIALLFEHPLVQCILIAILGHATLVYIIWKKPFASRLVFCHFAANEFANLIINTCLIILAADDINNLEESSIRRVFGDIISASIIVFMLLNNLFLFTYLVKGLITLYHMTKSNPQRGIISLLNALVDRLAIEKTKSVSKLPPVDTQNTVSFTNYTQNQTSRAIFTKDPSMESIIMGKNQTPTINLLTTSDKSNPVPVASSVRRIIRKSEQSEFGKSKEPIELNSHALQTEEVLPSDRKLI